MRLFNFFILFNNTPFSRYSIIRSIPLWFLLEWALWKKKDQHVLAGKNIKTCRTRFIYLNMKLSFTYFDFQKFSFFNFFFVFYTLILDETRFWRTEMFPTICSLVKNDPLEEADVLESRKKFKNFLWVFGNFCGKFMKIFLWKIWNLKILSQSTMIVVTKFKNTEKFRNFYSIFIHTTFIHMFLLRSQILSSFFSILQSFVLYFLVHLILSIETLLFLIVKLFKLYASFCVFF